jgi:asparagine N-glycosylation enzyme membrane subunit Stt3
LLIGYFSWKMLDIAGLSKLLAKSKEVVGAVKKFKKKEKKTRQKARQKTFMQPRGAWVSVIIVGIIIFFLVFFPNIGNAETLAGQANYMMNKGWYSSLLWLEDNSPEPFDDPDFYYELYPPRAEFEYPETAYAVMSWWDYGYFIMQISHRIPNANPMQAGAREAGQFFTAQNESSANKLANELGSKYVVIDYAMPITKFYAMVEWAGGNVSEFHEYYGVPPQVSGGGPQWLGLLYYPSYYNSTAVRLYNFNGQAVAPSQNSTLVIPWSGKTTWSGIQYKNIVGEPKYFSSCEEAEIYVSGQQSGNYAIVGLDPFATIVPLEELNSYDLVYQSEATTTVAGRTLPVVKIFKYLGSGES